LPNDVDLLVASVMDAELEGSWRESWSKDSVASKLKQVLRLMKTSPVAWVLVEAPAALLESDAGSSGTESVPVVCDLVSEFERLGYRWAHRTIAAAAFGVPDLKPRVFLVGSRHGDPRALLFAKTRARPPRTIASRATDDSSANGANTQAFVFNKRETSEGGDGQMRVFSDVVEGFYPSASSCALTPDGALAPMEVHDAERMQGLPPGLDAHRETWKSRTQMTGPSGNGLETDVDRWRALASSLGCVPAARWIGAKLASRTRRRTTRPPRRRSRRRWSCRGPPRRSTRATGARACASSPFPSKSTSYPTLGAFISGAPPRSAIRNAPPSRRRRRSSASTRCAARGGNRRRRWWRWRWPRTPSAPRRGAGAGERAPQTRGAPRASLAPAALGAAASAMPAAYGQMGALAGDPGSAAAAQAAALAALAPMMAAAAAAEQANLAAQANLSAPLAAASLAAARGAGAHEEAPRSKKSKTSHDAGEEEGFSQRAERRIRFLNAKTKDANAHTPSTTKREQTEHDQL